ncbi:MAG TPA: hypothetical protein PLY38_03895 [Candidatus Hydrothermia bacterium]|nr:hypothetical protein [Candidatus Hydrothermia bacterium]HOK23405.1 hypothetical protein [Candidatus Hydrothermia bacterium]HOL24215.1 hypothetical protein [Candidatus Hydrothermia bacterium]HPO79060.1 hypothetical protein [Candidatus Hydrothermia bacterium]HRD22971.1 hypothetical protein [Candidatus Hydrothermia bacterium]
MKKKFCVVMLLIFFLPNFLFAVCPLCIGIALGGSFFSRFLPGGKTYMISSLWMGFFLYATYKYLFEHWTLKLLKEKRRNKAVLKKVVYYFAFLFFYFVLLFILLILNRREFHFSWFFAYHAGFFMPMWGYEFYHFLMEKNIRLKYGNILLPVITIFAISALVYIM